MNDAKVVAALKRISAWGVAKLCSARTVAGGYGNPPRVPILVWMLGFVLPVAVAAGGCKRDRNQGTVPAQKVTVLADALRPDAFAAALKRIGGAHFHATARFTVGPSGGTPNTVTTTTDVWVDRTGNYRFREQNDRDGGREVVLYGRELAVALRYGKMIRRVAEEPEPSRLLEEALGAPFAV